MSKRGAPTNSCTHARELARKMPVSKPRLLHQLVSASKMKERKKEIRKERKIDRKKA